MPDIFDPIPCTDSHHPGVDRWNNLINAVAPQFHVPPNLVKAHMLYESGGDPNVVAKDGGSGLMQITYLVSIATIDGGHVRVYKGENIMDPRYNIEVACRDFIAASIALFPGNLDAEIVAYNAGDPEVEKALAAGTDLTTVTYAPWYLPAVRTAFGWFNETSHKVLGH